MLCLIIKALFTTTSCKMTSRINLSIMPSYFFCYSLIDNVHYMTHMTKGLRTASMSQRAFALLLTKLWNSEQVN